jgi:hypothetical protein
MKYEHPEIVALGSAMDAIQGGKPNADILDGDDPKATETAYEADE